MLKGLMLETLQRDSVMFNNNRHLNIFEHYTQKGSLPIENNVSRGLAILLNQNSLVLDRFIDFINSKCFEKKSSCMVPKPQRLNDKEIGIQQQIAKIVQSYPNPQNIIGITLTTASPINMIENKNDDNNGLITDIIISCKDTLVVIEVKRNAVDARLQLKQQVKSIAAEVVGKEGIFQILSFWTVRGKRLFRFYKMSIIFPEAMKIVF
jgi:hypothetical protein